MLNQQYSTHLTAAGTNRLIYDNIAVNTYEENTESNDDELSQTKKIVFLIIFHK